MAQLFKGTANDGTGLIGLIRRVFAKDSLLVMGDEFIYSPYGQGTGAAITVTGRQGNFWALNLVLTLSGAASVNANACIGTIKVNPTSMNPNVAGKRVVSSMSNGSPSGQAPFYANTPNPQNITTAATIAAGTTSASATMWLWLG